jgi:hypothetical protein
MNSNETEDPASTVVGAYPAVSIVSVSWSSVSSVVTALEAEINRGC